MWQRRGTIYQIIATAKRSPSFFEYSPTRIGWIRQWIQPFNQNALYIALWDHLEGILDEWRLDFGWNSVSRSVYIVHFCGPFGGFRSKKWKFEVQKCIYSAVLRSAWDSKGSWRDAGATARVRAPQAPRTRSRSHQQHFKCAALVLIVVY